MCVCVCVCVFKDTDSSDITPYFYFVLGILGKHTLRFCLMAQTFYHPLPRHSRLNIYLHYVSGRRKQRQEHACKLVLQTFRGLISVL